MSQPVSTPAATQPLPAIAETRLHGRRLILARAGWLVLVIPSIALFISSLIVSSQPFLHRRNRCSLPLAYLSAGLTR